jgi:hypothetical protein
MEARPHRTGWLKSAARVVIYTVGATVVIVLLFRWLVFWYDDIMPSNPPASLYENALSLVCTIAMWPFVVAALVLGKDPPGICWPPLWIVTGLSWGLAVEWLSQVTVRLRARTARGSNQHFKRWALIQLCIWALGCAFWFYLRASRILAHPTDPENYGSFGNNWRFQAFAFVMSRLLPVSFGLLVLLVAEWYVLLLTSSWKRSHERSPD